MAYTSVFNNKKYTKLHYLANQKSNRVNYFGFLVGVFLQLLEQPLLSHSFWVNNHIVNRIPSHTFA